jgi:L-amino acid N-acyltransferase YncA
MKIRIATPEDAAAVHAIYAPLVVTTPISFEIEPPGVEEMRRRIEATLPLFPWLVGEDESGAVNGYVYAGRYAQRAAYQWSVETTVYVRADARGQGVGRRLYADLLRRLREMGYCQAFAGITQPNTGSVALHERLGFTKVGVFRDAGFKFGAWHGVGYWELSLQKPAQPAPPRAFAHGSA